MIIGNGGLSPYTASAISQHNVLVGGASNAITSVAPSATSGVPLISQGAAADPAFGTAVVAGGGTGSTSFNINGPVISSTTTTGALTAITLAAQQFLVGNSAAPTAKAFSVVIQTFTSTGTYTPTAGMVYCIMECVGGGGGGGGEASGGAANGAAGAGGGSGAYSRSAVSAATVGASQAVTIGAAGSAGTNAGGAGGNGGTTSVGTIITAGGGLGGGGGTVGGAGLGGTAGTGTYAINGNPGGGSYTSALNSQISVNNAGGNSMLGAGGAISAGTNQSNAGVAGVGPGGGGSGGATYNGGAAAAGGAGSKGAVIITEFVIS